jgi:NAD(P)-dependent dehydrogenase (short-subunit alcohol dehydrogenase family)
MSKVVLVTGGSSGIGLETARQLAASGHRVLLHARTMAKGRAAVADIGVGNVEIVTADLTSLADVRQLAADVVSRTSRLDVLVNNAGGAFFSRDVTRDGYEMTFGVNHLAPFLLTNLLLPLLTSAAPARIVTVASRAHKRATLDFDDLMTTRGYTTMRAYARSKLANILFTRELARRLAGTNVTANALHPGVVRTQIGQNNPFMRVIGWIIMRAIAISVTEGAKTSLYLATSPTVEGKSGGYYDLCREIAPTAAAKSDADARRLWDVSEKLVGLA